MREFVTQVLSNRLHPRQTDGSLRFQVVVRIGIDVVSKQLTAFIYDELNSSNVNIIDLQESFVVSDDGVANILDYGKSRLSYSLNRACVSGAQLESSDVSTRTAYRNFPPTNSTRVM